MNIAEKQELRGSFLRHYRQIYWQEHKVKEEKPSVVLRK